MTRRTFLRVLGSGVVASAVVASVPILPSPPLLFGSWDPPTSGGAITYGMLERAYRECAIGSESPTMGFVSQQTARYLGLIYDVDVEEAA